MQILSEILLQRGLQEPDGRALHGYEITPDQHRRLGKMLRTRIAVGHFAAGSSAQGFVLWASERIRSGFAGGQLTWDFVFDGLGLAYDREAAVRLTEAGLRAWHRPLRQTEAGHREFLFSLLAEGGLPDLTLAEGKRYAAVLLNLIAEIEAAGALGPALAEAAALRAVQGLPRVMRTSEQARLLAAFAAGLAALRSVLPEGLAAGAAEAWLDAQRPGWQRDLPLRLSPGALEALVRPALAAARGRVAAPAVPVQRQLRLRDGGAGWAGVAVVAETARLAGDLMPKEAAGRVLRLLAETGAGFRAVPGEGGWDMQRSSARGPLLLEIDPGRAVVLTVHADGRALGEAVLDPGLPSPADAPGLWRPEDTAAADVKVLVPLSGRGQTRAAQVLALAAVGVVPEPGEGVTVGSPLPGPGGSVWPLSGQGQVTIGGQVLRVATGADAEAPPVRLVPVHAPTLPGWTAQGGVPIYLGLPVILGAEGDRPLAALGRRAEVRPLPRLLGGQVVAWTEGGVVLARLRLVAMPPALRLVLVETGAGRLRLEATGLEPTWHLDLRAAEARVQAIVSADGRASLDLGCNARPGAVTLRMTDPRTGAALDLEAPWPARQAVLLDPAGARLTANRDVSLARLLGWRGLFPASGGVVQLRLAQEGGQRVAFAGAGTARLAVHAEVIAQALALLRDADGRVNLRLVTGGAETPRLEIGRYDWPPQGDGAFGRLDLTGTALKAVCLDDPARRAQTVAEGAGDLIGWLGQAEGLWYVQGLHPQRGVMRPFVWSAQPRAQSTREGRVATYVDLWRRLLESPDDPGWDTAWEVIAAVRAAGDASGLDQVAALARVPAAAAALLLTRPRAERAAVLALEGEAPLWWPLVRCADWALAMTVAHDRLSARLTAAGIDATERDRLIVDHLARVAGEVLAQRPELAAHLGQAMRARGLLALALSSGGVPLPLAVPSPAQRLRALSQCAAQGFDGLPEGVGEQRARLLQMDFGLFDGLGPLLQAPLVVAEVAAGLRHQPTAQEKLQLIALRAADVQWFDRALPAALCLALETAP